MAKEVAADGHDTGPGDDGAGWVGLTEAIEALRASLEEAWAAGQGKRVRFRIEPVELTVQAGVTRTGKGSVGVVWNVLTLGGERSKETVSTQTLTLRLTPELFDERGRTLPLSEQLIAGRESAPPEMSGGPDGHASPHDPD